ncbi:MAG: cadherin domain-containing protein [Cyclobacteriaceae bacterium]
MKRIRQILQNTSFIMLILSSSTLMAQDPPDISLIFYLNENSEVGTLVGTVNATDPDGDQLTYAITSGNEADAFAISSTSGDITVSDQDILNFETIPSFVLMIEANDGNGGIIVTEVTINLNEIPLGFAKSEVLAAVYPNPTSKVFFVDFTDVLPSSDKITMYSLDGSEVSFGLQSVSNTKVEIDLEGLDGGVYLLQIVNENGRHFQRRIFKTN